MGGGILNVASGPARDVFDYLGFEGVPEYHFTCLELDYQAIGYAKDLLEPRIGARMNESTVDFIRGNALRYSTHKRFELIWSGGLFDYFNDRLFTGCLKRLGRLLSETGEIIIGNFGDSNESQGYMELIGEWILVHRTPEDLIRLAKAAGFSEDQITISSEESGVNLFLHIRPSGEAK